jgi:hypothetical protein
MKKLSLLLGALGGAMAGYVFSNSKLREELSDAKDAEAAGKILAKHLQKDSKQIGHEMKQFVESDEVQANLTKAKKYVQSNAKKLQNDLKSMISKGAAKGKKVAITATKKASTGAKKAVKKASKKK